MQTGNPGRPMAAAFSVVIEDKLDELPELFIKDIYNQKCSAVYQHLFENYFGEGSSVYAAAMYS